MIFIIPTTLSSILELDFQWRATSGREPTPLDKSILTGEEKVGDWFVGVSCPNKDGICTRDVDVEPISANIAETIGGTLGGTF